MEEKLKNGASVTNAFFQALSRVVGFTILFLPSTVDPLEHHLTSLPAFSALDSGTFPDDEMNVDYLAMMTMTQQGGIPARVGYSSLLADLAPKSFFSTFFPKLALLTRRWGLPCFLCALCMQRRVHACGAPFSFRTPLKLAGWRTPY
jgi:hypothetical protein